MAWVFIQPRGEILATLSGSHALLETMTRDRDGSQIQQAGFH